MLINRNDHFVFSVAWLIGWALILEYTIGSAAVARGITPNIVWCYFNSSVEFFACLGVCFCMSVRNLLLLILFFCSLEFLLYCFTRLYAIN